MLKEISLRILVNNHMNFQFHLNANFLNGSEVYFTDQMEKGLIRAKSDNFGQ